MISDYAFYVWTILLLFIFCINCISFRWWNCIMGFSNFKSEDIIKPILKVLDKCYPNFRVWSHVSNIRGECGRG
jgi:phosphatidylglycerophosphatase A